jgi:hypothetical protein
MEKIVKIKYGYNPFLSMRTIGSSVIEHGAPFNSYEKSAYTPRALPVEFVKEMFGIDKNMGSIGIDTMTLLEKGCGYEEGSDYYLYSVVTNDNWINTNPERREASYN